MGARPEPPLGIAILAIAMSIAVIDAAVETFLSSAHEAGMTDRTAPQLPSRQSIAVRRGRLSRT
jgi:hypothetical protein